MKKFVQNKKALSRVVAVIIVITVIVSLLSVAAVVWMGRLTVPLINVTGLTVTDVEFTIGDSSSGKITVYVINSDTKDFTVQRIRINHEDEEIWSSETSNTVYAGSSEIFTITKAITTDTIYRISFYALDEELVLELVGSYTAMT